MLRNRLRPGGAASVLCFQWRASQAGAEKFQAGMDPRAGLSTPNLLEAETNRATVAAGRRLVVVADSTTWAVVGLGSVAAAADAAIVVTDSGLTDHAAGVLGEEAGELVQVRTAATSGPSRRAP